MSLLGRTLVNFIFTFDKITKVFDNLNGKYDTRMCVRARARAHSWYKLLNDCILGQICKLIIEF